MTPMSRSVPPSPSDLPPRDPNRSRRRFLALSLVVMLPLVGGVLWSAAETGDKEPDPDALYRYLAIFSETLNLVRQTYVEPTDISTLLAGAMEGSTDALDPFSIYLPSAVPAAKEMELVPGARHAGMVVLKDRGVAYVAGVEEGSPAVAADIQSGDILSRIGGRTTRQMPVWEINREFVPADGRDLELEVVRRGETKTIQLKLAPSEPPPPSLEPVQGHPLLRIPRIDSAAVEVARGLLAKAAAEGAVKLMVDLRGISGGDPEAAFALAGLFAEGELGTLREKEKVGKSFTGFGAAGYRGQLRCAGRRFFGRGCRDSRRSAAAEGGRQAGRSSDLRMGWRALAYRARQRRPPLPHHRFLRRPGRQAALRAPDPRPWGRRDLPPLRGAREAALGADPGTRDPLPER